jgi:hypothetical protein
LNRRATRRHPPHFSTALYTKVSAVSLIPYGGGNGGRCIQEVFIRQSERPWFTAIAVGTVLVMLAAFGAWGYACYTYIFHA